MDIMKFKWLKAVLFISLGLNLCFLSSYFVVFSKLKQLKSPEGRLEMVARRLKLSGLQKERLAVLAREVFEHRQAIRSRYSVEIAEFRSELAKESPDYGKIGQLMAIAVDEHAKTDRMLAEKIQELLKALTPQQRQDIIRRWEKLNKLVG